MKKEKRIIKIRGIAPDKKWIVSLLKLKRENIFSTGNFNRRIAGTVISIATIKDIWFLRILTLGMIKKDRTEIIQTSS